MTLLLDLDGTLIDSDRAYHDALQAIDIDPKVECYRHARERVKARLGNGNVGARNRLLYFKEMLIALGGYSPARLLDRMDRYEKALEAIFKRQWQDLRRLELCEFLSSRFEIVLITNENLRTQTIKLRAIDPDGSLFPHVITSEEFGVEKPSLQLFEAAIHCVGAKASESVMVGDDIECDIYPALQLQMKAILSTEFSVPKTVIPDTVQVLSNLEQLKTLVLKGEI